MTMDSATRLLLVRHGETDWNVATRIQGATDIALNAHGREQAQRLGAALSDESIDAIYASDLSRARETAEAVATRHDLKVQLDVTLRERGFGMFEGLSWKEIAERYPAESARWRAREADFAPGGGERLSDFYCRSVSSVEGIAAQHPGQTVLIVSHGGVLDCLYRAASRQELQAPRTWVLGNASINRLLYTEAGLSLIGWNDDAHLAADQVLS